MKQQRQILISIATAVLTLCAHPVYAENVCSPYSNSNRLLNTEIACDPLGNTLLDPTSDSATSLSAAEGLPELSLDAEQKMQVFNMLDGVVYRIEPQNSMKGVFIEVHHPYPGLLTRIGPIWDCILKAGDTVTRGSRLGSTGHLAGKTKVMLSVRDGDSNVNPMAFLRASGSYQKMLDKMEDKPILNNRFFSFDDSAEIQFANTNLEPFTVKQWSSEEKKIVLFLLGRIKSSHPGLLQLCTTSGPVRFCRTSDITSFGRKAEAATCGPVIVLSDSFFLDVLQQRHCLTHELVHRADRFGFVTYSKPWISFAQPQILKFTSTSKVELAKTWPTPRGCENLSEALAEYVTYYVEDKFYPSRLTFDSLIKPMILSPSSAHLSWMFFMEMGSQSLDAKQNVKAQEYFKEAIKLFPEQPLPYYFMARLAAFVGDDKTMTIFSDRFTRALRVAHLPDSEPILKHHLGEIAGLRRLAGKEINR